MDIVVRLKKEPGKSLGIGFKKVPKPPYSQVSVLVDDGSAAACGKIQVGDSLLSVNGINVQHLTPGEVGGVLSRHATDANLTIELRRVVQTDDGEPATTNGFPSINVVPTSPESLSPDGPSPEPDLPMPSSTSSRRNRLGRVPRVHNNVVVSGSSGSSGRGGGGGDVLPDIHEGVDDVESKDLLQLNDHNQLSHRRSLTPESTRKSLEVVKRVSMRSSKSLDLSNLPQWRSGSGTSNITIHNLIDGTEMSDRLHSKGIKEYKDTGCSSVICKGSFMQLKPKRPYGSLRPREEVWPRAEDFIKQYYESKKVALGNDYEAKLSVRLYQVEQEMQERGTYDLTYEELVFGARTAWRNAPRCVNRIVWRQLEVLDARDAATPKDMFDAIIHHIKFANNGGNLRSTLTVFPNRTKPNSDFRVWNSQLIRYAGYKNAKGQILGDPSNVEFTEMLIDDLEWIPPSKRTQFDVLPLILQANGGDPEVFEIPPEIIIECSLSHPEYDWFKDLGLRWYALPAVSNMLLDCGGLEFPGIPFNGWYMGTEIARDLADVARYNCLKPIAQKMGLNTQTYKLWKDRAIVELNVAVLHSFQSSNISVADHHSTTESFITHMKSETQTRGGCPADWVWIVPPISGAVTPVFHQEMLLYNLSPSYEYQYDPWKYHTWNNQGKRRERAGSFQGPHRFKKLANMVKIHNLMYRKVYQKRVKATVLFATETGRARNYANVVKDVFGRVFASKVCCMEDYDKTNLELEQLLILVTSTFGSGDPPANGETLGRYLLDLRNGTVAPPGSQAAPTPRSHRMSSIVPPTPAMLSASKAASDRPLTQVKYAVFGLGSRAYPNFCTFAHTCDNLLRDLGAEMVYPCGEGDELCGQEESFQSWLQQCYHHACEVYSIDPEKTEGDLEGYKSGYTKDDFRIQPYSKPPKERDLCVGLKMVHSKDIKALVVKSRTKLQSPISDRSTILVVLGTNNQNISYEPGDHIAIYPQNHSKLVNELIQCLNLTVDPDDPIYIESRRVSHAEERWYEAKRMPVPVTVREALTYYLDITNPPSPQFLKLLAKQATRSTDQEELNELSKGGDKYEDWKYERFPNIVDVLNQFHSLKIEVTLLLQQLPLLQCRYYSISSSPKMYPNEVHVTVAIVSFKKRNGLGPKHNGVCSTWLSRIDMGSKAPCVIRKAHAFHMPEDPRTPIIMVGPGTGIAPYRSFWQDRMYMKNEQLKQHLNQPSQLQPSPPAPSLTLNQPAPAGRRRRKTEFEAPKPSLLHNPRAGNTLASPTGRNAASSMRRSLSDTENNEEITKMLNAQQKLWGNSSLYFGCRRSDLDFIYKDELKRAKVSNALNDVHVAFSREPGKTKTYVQHLLKDNAEKIVRQLIEERGHFYVCGDISMAADVSRTLQSIFEDNAAMSGDEARVLIESMKDRGFYHEDIFGVTLKHQEVTTRVRTAAKKAWRILVTADSGHPLQSPMTPNIRLPSPSPASRSYSQQAFDTANYDSSTLPSSRSARGYSKRPTVTVLIPPAITPPDSTPKTIDRGVYESKIRGKSSLQSSSLLSEDTTASGIKLLNIEDHTHKTILEPLSEINESPSHNGEKLLSPDHEVLVPNQDVPHVTIVESTPQSSPIRVISEEPEAPQMRKMPEEKKKTRRIRTNSRVETVL